MATRKALQATAARWSALALVCVSCTLQAQPPGDRALRLIVPTSPGSSADVGARLVGDRIQAASGRPVVIENKVGAGGSLAAAYVAAAAPNGETVGILGNTYQLFAEEFPSQKFDPAKDVVPVALISRGANVLLVASDSGYARVDDIVRKARSQPGCLSYASAGIGSSTYHSAERLRMASGLELIHIPYKGSPEAVQEVIAGRVDFAFAPVPVALSFIQGGRVKAVAVSASRRSVQLPDVPTTVEAGVPDSSYDTWLVALVPAKTPRAVQLELNRTFTAATATQEIRSKFASLGVEPEDAGLDETQAFVAREYQSAKAAHARMAKAK